jgi:predicted naringenin-chalcone synthase
VLTTDLSDVIERELAAVVTSFLARQGLTVDDIGTWMGHPGRAEGDSPAVVTGRVPVKVC